MVNLKDYLVSVEETELVARANAWLFSVVSGDVNIFPNGNSADASYGTPLSTGSYYPITTAKAEDINIFSPSGSAELSFEPKISSEQSGEGLSTN